MYVTLDGISQATIDRASIILNEDACCYIDKPAVERVRYYVQRATSIQQPLYNEYFSGIDVTQTQAIKRRFLDIGLSPEILTLNKGKHGTSKLSISAPHLEEVLKALPDTEVDSKMAIRAYLDMKEITSLWGKLHSYTQLPVSSFPSFEGHEMYIAKSKYVRAKTYRWQATDPNIQQIHRDLQYLYTSPVGYIPVFADSSQIEPKIIYMLIIKDERMINLIKLYNDVYYAMYHFVHGNPNDLNKIEIHKEERNRMKTYSNKFNYGGYPNKSNDEEVKYYEKITKHPERVKIEERIKSKVNAGAIYFQNIFGGVIDITSNESEYSKYQYSQDENEQTIYKNYLIRCAFNNPIQSAAAYLMCASVCHVKDLLLNTNLARLGYYKHDEVMCHVPEHIIDSVKWMVKDSVSYTIEDKCFIDSDMKVGRKELTYEGV